MLHVKESFYKGKVRAEYELIEALGKASIANLVGNRAVEAAITLGYVHPENTLTIDGIKHAQFAQMLED